MVPAALCPVCLAAAILQAPSGEALLALRAMRLPEGLRAELFAAEPHVTNPVAFWVDERGRVLVAETFRIEAGVTDTREHMGWLDDDLAARTVADRVAMYSKHLGDVSRSFTAEHDRVRLVEDTDGDRAADRATVFAGGFHAVEDGIGAGVISRGGDVWYACIPHLWLLRDKDGDGKAEKRTAIHSGYGVHVGYYGHDLHGLRFGPDGRLYFSIGDRGLNVETGGRRLVHLDAGAVLRCEPDGSGLEVFATGLRNPQELAFNEVGDLFTGDNNSDGGDEARWVHAVEGGDSGWRIGYQFIDGPVSRGPWNREKLWRPRPEGGAAYIVPPLANLAAGPSGLCFYPGTGLPERCGGRFFLADFRGANATSGVWSFALEPRGASYEVVDLERWVWGVLATDADFGPDGALYISDWVHGWRGTGKGRIYRVFDPALAKDPLVLGTRRLLEEGMDRRSIEELARLLEHPDQRVRQEAQFALVARGEAALPALSGAARRGPRLARLHAVWGLGQVARRAVSAEVRGAAAEAIVGSLRSDDAEARAQAAKTLAEAPTPDALERLLPLLTDPSPRARFFAAMTVGKLGRTEAVPAVLRLLEEDAGRDAFLRHAGVMALAGATGASALLPHAGHPSRSVRLGVLLALRRLESPEAARFLRDPEPDIALEAARAVHDVPIEAALPRLATLPLGPATPAAVSLRVLNARFRLGGGEEARAVAAAAADGGLAEEVRLEALSMLAAWAAPSGRDRVLGLWRPISARPGAQAAGALRGILPGLLRRAPEPLRAAAVEAAAALGLEDATPLLQELASDAVAPPGLRASSLAALERLGDPRLADAARSALRDPEPEVRLEGQRLLARVRPAEALPFLERALEDGSPLERQAACQALGGLEDPRADSVLGRWLKRLREGSVPLEVQLDLLEAAAQRGALRDEVAAYGASRSPESAAAIPAASPIARYRDCLAGGSAVRGRSVFFQKREVECQRCHKAGRNGGDVGPDLAGIGTRETREHILESIVAPNAKIAKGFETAALVTKDGKVVVGVLKAEDESALQVVTAEGALLVVPKDEVGERSSAVSAMPEDLVKHLTRRELRDLVEYLAGLQ